MSAPMVHANMVVFVPPHTIWVPWVKHTMPTITRARAQAIAREATVAARDKAGELQDDDRVALSGALKTLEESAVDAMAGGDSVNDVLGDLAESIDLTVQSIDDALGLSDEDERREALGATLSALDDASALIDVTRSTLKAPLTTRLKVLH